MIVEQFYISSVGQSYHKKKLEPEKVSREKPQEVEMLKCLWNLQLNSNVFIKYYNKEFEIITFFDRRLLH